MTANKKIQVMNETDFDRKQQTIHVKLHNNVEDNNSGADDDCQTSSIYSEAPRIAWDWICWSGAKTFDGMDFAGEVLANFLGLNQSKYQWILDAQEREEEEKQQRRLEKRQRRQLRLEQLLEAEQHKLQELELGAHGQDTDLVEKTNAM